MVAEQKDRLGRLGMQYDQALDSNQHLEILSYSLESEYNWVSSENFKMSNFVNSNQESTSSAQLLDMVNPADELSEAVL